MLFASWRLPPLAAAFDSDTASFLEKIKRNGGFDFSKLLRECGVDEATIEQIRMADRADFNSKLHCAIPYYKTSEKHTVCKTPCY